MRIRSFRSPMRSGPPATTSRSSAADPPPPRCDANGFTLFADADDRALAAGDDAPITPLLELDMEREYRDLRGFADRIARARMARTLALARPVATRPPRVR